MATGLEVVYLFMQCEDLETEENIEIDCSKMNEIYKMEMCFDARMRVETREEWYFAQVGKYGNTSRNKYEIHVNGKNLTTRNPNHFVPLGLRREIGKNDFL